MDLGVKLHEARCRWFFSRWALGYHIADADELVATKAPRNPFRDPEPQRSRFAGALENLERLEGLHPEHRGVADFCARVRADIAEICDPPSVVGVEMGAPEAFDWPFAPRRLHERQPGGLPQDEIFERLAYAQKLGARSLYLLGGDVALRPELPKILEVARERGLRDITIETTAISMAGLASPLAAAGLSGASVEVLVGLGHPLEAPEVVAGVAAMREAGIRAGAKIVVGEDRRDALESAIRWIENTLELPIDSVVVLEPSAESWVRALVGDEIDVEICT